MEILPMAAAFAAFFVKGLAGFANTLVFSSVLSFSADNRSITPLELILGYPANLFIAWKERRSIQLRVFLPLAAVVILGSIPGAVFLKMGDTRLVKGFFGIVVMLVGGEMLLRDLKNRPGRGSPALLTAVGLASGVLCGLFGVGALLAAYVSRTSESQGAFRGTLCAVFVAENTFRLFLYSMTGILTASILTQALMLLPWMALGLGAGVLLSGKLPERAVKRTVEGLLILSGAALLIR